MAKKGRPKTVPSELRDGFYIELGTGLRIESFSASTSNVSGPAGFNSNFFLKSPSGEWVLNDRLPLNSTSEYFMNNQYYNQFGDGLYWLSVTAGTADEVAPFSLDYSFDISVTTVVPIPASVWLFGSGLIGLIGFARRKKV